MVGLFLLLILAFFMFFVYILYSVAHDKFYIGQTANIEQRLHDHNVLALNSFCSKYRPWQLSVALTFPSRSDARKAEIYLKKKNKTFWQRVCNEPDLQQWIIDKFSVE